MEQLLPKGQLVLQLIFTGLNEEKREVYQAAGECFGQLPMVPDIVTANLNFFTL